MSIFSYRKRRFLSPLSTGHTSYILAEAESTRGGEYKWGYYMVTLADCRRCIQLEFFLGTERARRASLAKIDLLIKVLQEFRAALQMEASLIECQRRKAKEGLKLRQSKSPTLQEKAKVRSGEFL